jgi:hypothetical protein
VRALIVLGLVVVAAPAWADSAARQRAGRAVFDRQVRALGDNKLDAFSGMFADGDRAAAMFPSSRAVAVGRTAIRSAASNWAGVNRVPVSVTVVGTPHVGVKPDDDTGKRPERLVVVNGDLAVTVRGNAKPIALRMTSVLSSGLDRANPSALVAVAVLVSEAVDDNRLRGEDVVAEYNEHGRFLDLLRFMDVLAGHFDAGPDDMVIGSAPGERGRGADAAKLLAGWKELHLAVVGKPHVVKESDWSYVIGIVSMPRTGKSKPSPLNVLLVGYPECAKTCVGTDMTPHVIGLHFGHAP